MKLHISFAVIMFFKKNVIFQSNTAHVEFRSNSHQRFTIQININKHILKKTSQILNNIKLHDNREQLITASIKYRKASYMQKERKASKKKKLTNKTELESEKKIVKRQHHIQSFICTCFCH